MKGEFNPKRFKMALEYRGRTVTELADTIGFSRQHILDYKAGKIISVNKEIVKKIAETLDFPYNFFYEEDVNIVNGAVYFRSQLTTKKAYRNSQKIKLKLIAGIYAFLNEYIEFPRLDIPDCSGLTPSAAALKLREHWGLGTKPIENIVPIVEQKGIIVTCCDTNTDAIDAFSEKFILPDGKEVYIIGYSSNKKSAARIHFDIAHELGHICLHDWYEQEELDKEDFKEREDEANLFASAFLLPEDSYKLDAKLLSPNLRNYTKLKKKWNTSIGAMLIRSRNLGFIAQNEYKDMIIRMQKLGCRKQEPLDDELLTAEPSILKTAVALLLNNNIFSKKEFLDALTVEGKVTLYPTQIEGLLSLPSGMLQENRILEFRNMSLKNI